MKCTLAEETIGFVENNSSSVREAPGTPKVRPSTCTTPKSDETPRSSQPENPAPTPSSPDETPESPAVKPAVKNSASAEGAPDAAADSTDSTTASRKGSKGTEHCFVVFASLDRRLGRVCNAGLVRMTASRLIVAARLFPGCASALINGLPGGQEVEDRFLVNYLQLFSHCFDRRK